MLAPHLAIAFITMQLLLAQTKAIFQSESAQNESQHFLLNPAKIDALFRRAALLALLKAKARLTLKQVPHVERVIFGQCLADRPKPTPCQFAKCLAKLLQTRDQLEQHKAAPVTDAEELRSSSARIGKLRHFFILWRRRKAWENGRKWKRRQKRKVANQIAWLPENLRNLEKLQRYQRALAECRRFITRMCARNAKCRCFGIQKTDCHSSLIAKMVPNAKVLPDVGTHDLLSMQRQIERVFADVGTERVALLSPSLFSLFPSSKRNGRLLSPELLAFHNRSTSPLSLPKLLSLASIGRHEQIAWIDLLLNVTGTGRVLTRLLRELGPRLERIEAEVLPAIQRVQAQERNWARLRASLDIGQRIMIRQQGYAHLRQWQRALLKEEDSIGNGAEQNWDESRLEAKIMAIAQLDEADAMNSIWAGKSPIRQEQGVQRRKRRQVGGVAPDTETGGLAPDTETGQTEIPRILTLRPFAFDTRLGGVILEGLFLSPHAFYRELTSPELLTIHVLSPVAFYATILSPMALIARIINPEAFKAQILTPQFMTTYTLSPEAFLAEVLSPVAAEARVLAPRTLFVQILGPTAGAVHVGSPDTHGVLVLSPHLLSPRIYSEERYLIEVLSPHFLGGEHSHEVEEDSHDHFGGAVRFVGWPGHSPLGESENHAHGGEGGHGHAHEGEGGGEHAHGAEEAGHAHGAGEEAAADESGGHVHGNEAAAGESEAAHAGAEAAPGSVHAGEEAIEGHLAQAAGSVGNGVGEAAGHVHAIGEGAAAAAATAA